MKTKVLALAWALALAGGAAAPVLAQPSVGVSVGINQPGVYGRVDIGNYPPPALVYPQPVIVTPAPAGVRRQPIYLYVPPLYQRNWHRYCGRYNACGQPVYFVQERWIRDRWQHEHRGWRDDRRGGHYDRGDHGRPDQRFDRDRYRGRGSDRGDRNEGRGH